MPYIISRRESDDPIGMLEASVRSATIDLGYVLAAAQQGRGLMPEAVRALTELALSNPGVFHVQAVLDVENVASRRVLEKCGFAREGRLERCMVHRNLSPESRPCFLYARWRQRALEPDP